MKRQTDGSGCERFNFYPRPAIECCQACHGGEEGHHMSRVPNFSHQSIEKVCHPVADRLRAMGYLVKEVPSDE